MPSNFRLCVFRTNWKLYHEHRIFMDALWHHISIFAVVNVGKSVKDIPVFPSLGTLGFWEKAGLYRSLSHTEVSSGLRLFAKWGNAVWHIHLYGSCRLWREMCNNFVSSEAKCRLCAMANKWTSFWHGQKQPQNSKEAVNPTDQLCIYSHQGVNLFLKSYYH